MASRGNQGEIQLTAKDFETITQFYVGVMQFLEKVQLSWPDCEPTRLYIAKMKALEGNEKLIAVVVRTWHKEMLTKCWEDAKGVSRTLYDAIDKDFIDPIERANVKILDKIGLREKLAGIRANPNEDEVEDDIKQLLKAIKNINSFTRVIMGIDGGVRKVIQEHSAHVAQCLQNNQAVDLRPLKMGEEIAKKISSDPRKQRKAMNDVVKNASSLAPAIDNMCADHPAMRGQKPPSMSEMVNRAQAEQK